MKNFLTVLQFELKEYFSSKGFIIMTLVLALVGAVGLCAPRFMDLSDFTGVGIEKEAEEDEEKDKEEKEKLYLYDATGIVIPEVLESYYPENEWIIADSEKEVEKAVASQEAEEGFVVTSGNSYKHYVYNTEMFADTTVLFEEVMREFYRIDYCAQNQLNYEEIAMMYTMPIESSEQILNKDSSQNYWYSYALVMIVFMMIILYGQMIATAVTNEKSNRAIEVLVTSTTPNSLLFGKVIAGAIGGLVQLGIVMGSVLVSYQCNRAAWGEKLDFVLQIPAEVLVTFALFGLGGYLFYAFLFGAMGALVSKTEDVSKSSGGLVMVIMVVYFIAMYQLTDVESMFMKVLSFLPFSSYTTMFIRIAMGTVEMWEIVVSFLILVVSIFGAGVLGAKIYRMGTLRYGNPIKLSTAIKALREKE